MARRGVERIAGGGTDRADGCFGAARLWGIEQGRVAGHYGRRRGEQHDRGGPHRHDFLDDEQHDD
jgi:hypothetical protein